MSDLSKVEIDKVWATHDTGCAITTTFGVREREQPAALGFGLVKRARSWRIRDIDFLPLPDGPKKFVDGFLKSYPKAAKLDFLTRTLEDSDSHAVARRYGRALATADEAVLRTFWKLEDALDRDIADLLLAAIRQAARDTGSGLQIDLVHSARVGDRLLACYLLGPLPPFSDEASPIFEYFEYHEKSWRTRPLASVRAVYKAREMSPEDFGRQVLLRRVIDLRFGTTTWKERIAIQRATVAAHRALAAPPYGLGGYGQAADAIEKQLADQERLAGLEWREIEALSLADARTHFGDIGSPKDFLLAFYLEASESKAVRAIAWHGKVETFAAEQLPCLTAEDVANATVTVDPSDASPSVSVSLTEFGAQILKRASKENIGKKLAIVADGRVVSAPTIRDTIGGGEAIITGNFSDSEAYDLVERLNARVEKSRAFVKKLRAKLDDRADSGLGDPAPRR